ncbi:Lipase 1 [Smittium mucronatum]|uniref:Lipase 1 n=1 Tax=Smittium mucronatum TaxID=133383 RepID=A0A1R0H0H2_9FUNG|nr:Lipase 1 [Smittium mucronatum]
MSETVIKNLISTSQAFSGHLDIKSNCEENGKLYIEDSGETQDTKGILLCVPGMGDVRTSFRFLIKTFIPKNYRIIVSDIRGMGDSWEGFNEFNPELVSADISQIIELRGLKKNVVLVGNSLSAGSCVLASLKNPDIVMGVIMLGPVVHDMLADKYFRPLSLLIFFSLWGSSLWASYYAGLYKRNTKPDGYENHLKDIKSSLKIPDAIGSLGKFGRASKVGVEKNLSKLAVPTIAIYGDQDPDYPDATKEMDWLLNKTVECKNIEAFVLEKVGHYPHVEAFDETKDILEKFLVKLFG